MSVPENEDQNVWLSEKQKVQVKGPSIIVKHNISERMWKKLENSVSEMEAWTIRNLKLEEKLLFNF